MSNKIISDVISYDMTSVLSKLANSNLRDVNSIYKISYKLSHNNLYLSTGNAADLFRFIRTYNTNENLRAYAALRTYAYTNCYVSPDDINYSGFNYFPAIDCDGNNIIIFYFNDGYNSPECFLKARTGTKYEDKDNFSLRLGSQIYDMIIYYRIDNYDCVFLARKGNDDIETNIILDGEVLQGSIYKNDLDYIHEIDPSIIDKIIDIKCSVEVKCKLAGIIQ